MKGVLISRSAGICGWLGMLIIATTCLLACRTVEAQTRPSAISPVSTTQPATNTASTQDNKLSRLEQIWTVLVQRERELKVRKLIGLMTLAEMRAESLGTALRNSTKKQFDAEYEMLVRRNGQYTEYQGDLYDAMFYILVDRKDEDRLSRLMATSLHYLFRREKQSERLLVDKGVDIAAVVFKAFQQCTNESTKQELVDIMCRLFSNLWQQAANDDEFMAMAYQWYEKNKDSLVINEHYRKARGKTGNWQEFRLKHTDDPGTEEMYLLATPEECARQRKEGYRWK